MVGICHALNPLHTMNVPSKPVLIALAGVAGLAVVIGGIFWLRSRTISTEDIPAPQVTTAPTATTTLQEQREASTSTEPDFPDGKGVEVPRDSDGDGLSDDEESRAGTNVFLRDTDGDGITDYEEARIFFTDPLHVDPPARTITPVVPVQTPPVISPSSTLDSDRDGLTDQDEVKYQTNPLNPDTDGDSYTDGAEVQKGYDPRGPGKCPNSSCLP